MSFYESELEDRFGKLPVQSQELIQTVKLKFLAIENGFEKLILKNQKMICQFNSNQNDPFFQSESFQNILKVINQNHDICQLKEKKSIKGERLLLVFEEVYNVEDAINYLKIF